MSNNQQASHPPLWEVLTSTSFWLLLSTLFLLDLVLTMSIHHARGWIKVDVGSVAAVVFQVAVTLYALLQTVGSGVITQAEKLREFAQFLEEYEDDPAYRMRFIRKKRAEMEVDMKRGQVATGFSLASVLLSAVTIFIPQVSCGPLGTKVDPLWFRPDYFFLALSIGCLLLSAVWILPFILGSLNPSVWLQDVKRIEDSLGEKSRTGNQTMKSSEPA